MATTGTNLTVWTNSANYYFDPTNEFPATAVGGNFICIASGAGFQVATYLIQAVNVAYSSPGTNADTHNVFALAKCDNSGVQMTVGQLTPVATVAATPQSGAHWGFGTTVAAAQSAAGYTPTVPAGSWTEPAPNTSITGVGAIQADGDSRVQYVGTRLQAELQRLFPNAGITVNNGGQPGALTSAFSPGTARFTQVTGYMNTNAIKYYFLSTGVNDSKVSVSTTAATFQSETQAIVDALYSAVSTLRLVILAEPFYTVPGSGAGDFTAASNTLQQAYIAALSNITRAIFVPGLDSFFSQNPSLLIDGLHPTPGDMVNSTATANDGQSYEVSNWATAFAKAINPPAGATDPYQSDYSNTAMQEVNFKPSAPGPLVATGLGTAIKPEGDLSYIVPGNMQGGRIVFERRIHLSGNAFLPVGKVDGLDANTAPVSTWQDLNVANGVTYEWRAYALPKGDFNPSVFP